MRNKSIFTILILVVAVILVSVFPARATPASNSDVVFVDFNRGAFQVPRLTNTWIPLTSNSWSQVENRSSVFSLSNDHIYILHPDVRVVISGKIDCTNGKPTYLQISYSVQNGAGDTISEMNKSSVEMLSPVASVNSGSFYMQISRSFIGADFENGNPYIVISIRHNAIRTLSCTAHLQVEAK